MSRGLHFYKYMNLKTKKKSIFFITALCRYYGGPQGPSCIATQMAAF